MSCEPERVTGFVDGALGAGELALLEAHLESCADCQAQAAFEQDLRSRLKGLPGAEPPADLERRVRLAVARGRRPVWRWAALPLAAGLLLGLLWLRGEPGVVAHALAFDHAKCFRHDPLPAKVWSGNGSYVAAWFEAQGTPMPQLPASLDGLELVGARYCPLLDASNAAHVYYVGEGRRVSVFVLSRRLRLERPVSATAAGEQVRMFQSGGRTIAVVGNRAGEVDSLRDALRISVAALLPQPAARLD